MRKRKFSHDSEQFYTLTAFIGTERVRGSQELLIKMIINECEHIYKSRCFGRGQSMICLCNTYWTIQPPAARKNFVFAKWVLVVPRGCWLLLSEITSIEGTVSKTSWCLNCSVYKYSLTTVLVLVVKLENLQRKTEIEKCCRKVCCTFVILVMIHMLSDGHAPQKPHPH